MCWCGAKMLVGRSSACRVFNGVQECASLKTFASVSMSSNSCESVSAAACLTHRIGFAPVSSAHKNSNHHLCERWSRLWSPGP